jgi:hypothetical protein
VIRTLGLTAAAAVLAVPSFTSATHVGTRRPHPAHSAVALVHGVAGAKVPTIRIVGTGLGAHFKPDGVNATLSSPSKPCTGSDDSLVVTNSSALDQDIIEGTSDFVNLPAGSTAAICLYSNGSSAFTFGLANADTDHTLGVTVN